MATLDEYEVAHYAVYSKKDGVVEWQSCAEEDPELNDEVSFLKIDPQADAR